MFKVLRDWIQRYFSDEEAVVLAVLLFLAFTAVLTLGGMLAPVLAGMVLAYLMQGLVTTLERLRLPGGVAVGLVFALFMGVLVLFIVVVLPLLWHQLITLFNELPGMLAKWQSLLLLLPERYPHLVSDEQVLQAIEVARGEIGKFGQWALTFSLSSLPLLVNIMIYLVLVPILVFFFLKDRAMIGRWVSGYLPRERALITRVAEEMNRQIANYIRGKVIEIIICGGVTYIAFIALDLNYAALLALLVGISVVVPYVGAVVVTVPVTLIALFQWGWSDQFIYLMAVYGIIQTLDGNVLVPLLFSEAVNLHPVAIICAVLLFGGLWGFWGVFFAIPLATLFKAVLDAWPRQEPVVAPLIVTATIVVSGLAPLGSSPKPASAFHRRTRAILYWARSQPCADKPAHYRLTPCSVPAPPPKPHPHAPALSHHAIPDATRHSCRSGTCCDPRPGIPCRTASSA